jgi:hypothetical protein
MAAYTNEYGNIDIGKAGCSDQRFLARFEEIEAALLKSDPSVEAFRSAAIREGKAWVISVFSVFLSVNLLGIAIVGARKAIKWVASGYLGE